MVWFAVSREQSRPKQRESHLEMMLVLMPLSIQNAIKKWSAISWLTKLLALITKVEGVRTGQKNEEVKLLD